MRGRESASSLPDPLELARARMEYGEALRALRALETSDKGGSHSPELRRSIGEAQDRVARAAARLSSLSG